MTKWRETLISPQLRWYSRLNAEPFPGHLYQDRLLSEDFKIASFKQGQNLSISYELFHIFTSFLHLLTMISKLWWSCSLKIMIQFFVPSFFIKAEPWESQHKTCVGGGQPSTKGNLKVIIEPSPLKTIHRRKKRNHLSDF